MPVKPRFFYIDCARGYAVLMVITCHLTYQFPELPYPVHRLTVTGWYGVELFFLASCVTLLMSWRFETENAGSADTAMFFVRRFLRIAPAYYAAAVLYFFLAPPSGGFNAWQLAASMTFVNAWHPLLTPTVAGAWSVVPGGWSISVEFTFYMLFPFFALWITTLSRALLTAVASIVIGVIANRVEFAVLNGSYEPMAIDNFLFFWFPNQMCVFALGGVLYFLLRETGRQGGVWHNLVQGHGTWLGLGAVIVFLALAYVPMGHYLGASPMVPELLAITFPLMAFVIALSANRGILVNRYVAAMGKVSFSAYLLHFAVLHIFETWPETLHARATGVGAIVAFAAGWVITVLITYGLAWLSYRIIEQPFIDFAKAIVRARTAHRAAIAVGPPA
jgi:peptidoglycan/LPS O-acetylase OafA/YrhL